MRSVFESVLHHGPAGLLFQAIVVTAILIALLLAFIFLRRAWRRRQIRRREQRTVALRRMWEHILGQKLPPEKWLFDRLDRGLVEEMLLDRLAVAPPAEAAQIEDCLRRSGLVSFRSHEARHERGWRRRQALLSLGRMRLPEGIPALAEALDDPDPETRLAALRGLGAMGLPEAAEPVLERFVRGAWKAPATPLVNALLYCCKKRPALLTFYLAKADEEQRPLLARVLGEVATPELEEDLLNLAGDPLPEVRASVARAIGRARPRLAMLALSHLVNDKEWFVRLRAVAAVGELRDPRCIPILIDGLCDPNRYVRLRAASGLARMEGWLEEIIEQTQQRRDRYAMQALVSELERSGGILELVDALGDPARRRAAGAALLAAVRAGAHRLLLDAMVQHANWRVRVQVARLLAASGEIRLLPQLERIRAAARTAREARIAAWLAAQLERSAPAGPRPQSVPV
jgi:HEAT repeat protein